MSNSKVSEIKQNLAIVIGINEYIDLPKLKTAVSDAAELAKVLRERYKYQVLELCNDKATKTKLDKLIKDLKNKTIPFNTNSRVLFYFAGHGFAVDAQDSEDGKPAGYFMPQDADNKNKNTWLSMHEVYEAFSNLGCHHLLMILDCCFAGRISWVKQGRNAAPARKLYQQSYARFIKHKTEQIITSAAHDEKAQDLSRFGQRGEQNGHSPFAHLLLKVLKYDPKRERKKDSFIEAIFEDKVITLHELFAYLQNELGKSAKDQTPSLSQPRIFDQDTGEYVYLKGEYIFPLPEFKPENLAILKLDRNSNPYQGLASFDTKDSNLFFGRTTLSKELEQKVTQQLLTVVLGASGSGKSSLVKAGLSPLLQTSLKQKWQILPPMRPGESPFKALNKILTPVESSGSSIIGLPFQERIEIISDKIKDWFNRDSSSKLLLVIDQSEELLTMCSDEKERKDFLNLLAEFLSKYREKLHIVLTLRSDFEPQLRDIVKEKEKNKNKSKESNKDSKTYWQEAWQEGRFFVTPMNREELQQVIEEPAAQKALYFESPDLVNKIIDEVINTPGALPLLSFTLSELFLKYLEAEERQERSDRTITKEDYQELGGVARSLTQTADNTYQELIEKEKINSFIIRNVMLRMVAFNSGQLTRRRVPKSELKYPKSINQEVETIINSFDKARLFERGTDAENQEYVEPVHDALVTGWTKIKYWLEETEEIKQINWWNSVGKSLNTSLEKVPLSPKFKKIIAKSPLGKISSFILPKTEQPLKVNLQLQRELNSAANRWENNKSAQSLWNSDPRINLLKQLLGEDDHWFNLVETEFVQRSVGRKTFNIRLRWAIAIAVMLGLSGLTIAASIARNNAQKQEIDALRQASEGNWLANNQLDALIPILKAAKNLQENEFLQATDNSEQQEEVLQTLRKVVYGIQESNRLQMPPGEYKGMVASTDGKLLVATVEQPSTVTVWNLTDGQEKIAEFSGHQANEANEIQVAFDSHGQQLVSSDKEGNIRLWDIQSQEVLQSQQIPSQQSSDFAGVKKFSFSPDSQQIAILTLTDRQKLLNPDDTLLWNLTNNQVDRFYGLLSGETPMGINFTNNDKLLIATSKGNIFDWFGNKQPTPSNFAENLPTGAFNILDMIFSSNGEELLVTSYYSICQPVIIFDFSENFASQQPHELKGGCETSFSQDSTNKIVIGNESGNIYLYDQNRYIEPTELNAHEGIVLDLSFTPDDRQLISVGEDNNINLFGVEPKNVNNLSLPWSTDISNSINENQDNSKFLNFSDENKIIAIQKNGSIYSWDLSGKRELLLKTDVNPEDISSVVVSSDLQKIAIAREDNTIEKWNLLSKQQIKSIELPQGNFQSMIFHPEDGNLLITTEQDYTTYVWDDDSLETPLMKKDFQSTVTSLSSIIGLSLHSDNNNLLLNFAFPASEGGDRLSSLDVEKDQQVTFFDPIPIVSNGMTAVSRDTQLIAITDKAENTIKLWDYDSKELLVEFKTNQNNIEKIYFSPDNTLMMTVSEDGTTKLWQIGDLDYLRSKGCDWIQDYLKNGANLTEEERRICYGVRLPDTTMTPLQAIAEDYFRRGNEAADSQYLENFDNILNNSTINTEKAEAYINKGVIHFRQQEYDLALESYDPAIELNTNNVDAYINRGITYSTQEQHQQAIEDYNNAIALDANNTDAYISRGIAYSGIGEHQQAIQDYDEAIALDPNNPDAYYAKGFTLTLQEESKQEAIEAFQQAANLYREEGKIDYADSAEEQIRKLE